jgi:hypothetical protein
MIKDFFKGAAGAAIGATGGGILGSILANTWSKKERDKLEELTKGLLSRLKRQPRLYSMYVRLDQMAKDIAILEEDNPTKKKLKHTFLTLTQKFLNGLSDKDKRTYLDIQKLTDSVYKIDRNSMAATVTIGGIIGLIIGGNL